MSDTLLRIQPPSLPAGYCMPGTVLGFVNDIFNGAYAILPDQLGQIFISPNTPGVEYRSRVWFKTSSADGQILGIFKWMPTYGLWLSNHWMHNGGVPPTDERRIFNGDLIALETYDGGEAGTVSDVTGPFWEEDTTFQDNWPIGVGTYVATVANEAQIFDDATPGDPKAVGVYFIKPTGRLFDRGS